MSRPRWDREQRSTADELRELRDIACREHGPEARSTRQIEACLEAEERVGQARHSTDEMSRDES